jgi:hypothetical protein
MARLNLQDIDFEDMDEPTFEPIRRSAEPVSGKHDLQRRAENGINRFRKARTLKENAR